MAATDVFSVFDPETLRGDFPILSQRLPDGRAETGVSG